MLYKILRAVGDFKVGDLVASTSAELDEKHSKRVRRVMPKRIEAWLASGHVAAPVAEKPVDNPVEKAFEKPVDKPGPAKPSAENPEDSDG